MENRTKGQFRYEINHPGEYAAGIIGFSDTVTINIGSGDPGGDKTGEDSFQEFMRQALLEWYDGASVDLGK